jgi:hypothetical protein
VNAIDFFMAFVIFVLITFCIIVIHVSTNYVGVCIFGEDPPLAEVTPPSQQGVMELVDSELHTLEAEKNTTLPSVDVLITPVCKSCASGFYYRDRIEDADVERGIIGLCSSVLEGNETFTRTVIRHELYHHYEWETNQLIDDKQAEEYATNAMPTTTICSDTLLSCPVA